MNAAKTATTYGQPFDKPEKLHGSEQPQHPSLDDDMHANDDNNGTSLDHPGRFNNQDNGGDGGNYDDDGEDDDDEDDDDDGEDGRMELLSKRHEELRRQLADLMREQELEMEQRRKEARSKKKKKKRQQQQQQQQQPPAVPLVVGASVSAPTLGDMSGGSGGGSQAHSPIHADADSWKTPGRGEQDGGGHHDDEFVDASSSASAVGPSATATTPAAKTSVRGGVADGSYSAREVRLIFFCMRSGLLFFDSGGFLPFSFVRWFVWRLRLLSFF
jgi:hypothetical protein